MCQILSYLMFLAKAILIVIAPSLPLRIISILLCYWFYAFEVMHYTSLHCWIKSCVIPAMYVIPVNHLLKNTAWNANNWYDYNRTVTRGFKRGYITINVGPTVKYQSILTESKIFNEEHFFFSAQTQKGTPWEGCCLRVIICILHQEILNKAYRHLR